MACPERDDSGHLAGRIARGDAQAEAELVARYRPGLLVMLRHRLPAADAQDLCHETLRVAIENLRAGRLHDSEKLSAYLWGIASRLSRRARQRAGRETSAGDAVYAQPDPSPGPDATLVAREQARRVRLVLMRLAARDRQILRDFYLRGRATEEICRRWGLSPSRFHVIKFRALRRLARLWQGSPNA